MQREIAVEVDFCYGHRLLGYSGKCSHYHGHNAKVQVCITGPELNELGFVVDFSDLKSGLKDWINTHWDHHMILNLADPGLESMRTIDSWVTAINTNPTAEWMAEALASVVNQELIPQYKEKDIKLVSVKVWETPTSFATFRADGTCESGGERCK